MNPTIAGWLEMPRERLDELYKGATAGSVPTGDTLGTAIVGGAKLAKLYAGMARLFFWRGKIFDIFCPPDTGVLVNKITPFSLTFIVAKVYKDASWMDGKETIVIDYSRTSFFAKKIRDEIREIEPGVYLGKVWWGKRRILDFALESREARRPGVAPDSARPAVKTHSDAAAGGNAAVSGAAAGTFGGQGGTVSRRKGWKRVLIALLIAPTILLVALGVYLLLRFGGDTPVVYGDIEEHFKYGSTGGEREAGIPYWIFQVLPRVFPQHLPGPGYASLGFIYEEGKDLPVGMSKRHHLGMDRTFLNCAVCHTSTVRDTPQSKPCLYLGMPANTFDIKAFQRFLFACARDPKFSKKFILPEVRRLMLESGRDLDLMDRYIVYPAAILIARDQLLTLSGRLAWAVDQYDWGPGRVDTFNAAKMLFSFPMDKMGEHEQNAPADLPSIWYQGPRQSMQLHWDGNNTKVEERNKSAAFGTGTTPPTIDVAAVGRLEKWLLTKDAPKYPYPVDQAKASQGAGPYRKYCAACHGAGGRDFSGAYVGKVTPIEEIGTDRHRLDSYSYELAVNQSTLYAGYPWRFTHFRKTFGYANMPLDGIWLRAPYLHNGSVPTLRDLLEPSPQRPKVFWRGYDVYDPVKVGFRTDVAAEGARKYFRFAVDVPGNGNAGHEGGRFGTALSAPEKEALVEYLKTF